MATHFSMLESPMDRGTWQAIVHGVSESDMPEQLSTHTHTHIHTHTLRKVFLLLLLLLSHFSHV